MIACPTDFDSIDDISLEDVVPLDPFLSGSTFKISQTLPLLQGDPLLLVPTISNWSISFDQLIPDEPAFFERNQTVELKPDKGRWLVNQVILS